MQVSLLSRRLASAAAIAIAALSGSRADAQAPTSLTFFGDSFTDTGNGDILTALFGVGDLTPSPPYAPGRITNGLNWAEYLAASFGRAGDANPSLAPAPFTGRNLAVGSATTGLTGIMGLPIGMLSQYGTLAPGAVDGTGLYVLFGGSNDLLGAAALNPVARAQAIQTAVANISTIAGGLYSRGARNFLIPFLPDVGKAPGGAANSAVLSEMTAQFNFALGQALAVGAGLLPGSNFMSLNLNNLYTNILYDAALGGSKYGITNTAVPCFLIALPTACDSALFADNLHPTTKVHALIAEAAFNRVAYGVDVAVVPEPGTVLLVGCGLLLCGVAARRNTKVRANNNAAY
ncbi:MAG: SGNH/GDSL hydrolase family protein [Gemmatimonas sp.]